MIERPAVAIAFASAVAEWAYVEDDIEKLYAFLMSRWTDEVPTVSVMPAHPVAVLTFDTLQTLNQRLSLLSALAKWALEKTEATRIEEAIKQIRKRARERNRVAHGLWGIAPDEPEALILLRHFEVDQVYLANDFQEIAARIEVLHTSLNHLMRELLRHVASNGWRLPGRYERPPRIVLG